MPLAGQQPRHTTSPCTMSEPVLQIQHLRFAWPGQSTPCLLIDEFQIAAGDLGYKFFGIVLWSAAITSVVGAAYTSVSFLRSMSKTVDTYNSYVIMAFILISTLVFVLIGRPVAILVLVGSLNGLILPITLGAMLLAARNKKIVGTYQHPRWLFIFGILAVLVSAYAGATSLQGIASLWK